MYQDDLALLLDMQIAAKQARSYVEGVNRSDFEGSELIQDAVAHQLLILGEAATRVSAAFRDSHDEIPWHQIAGMRHRLVHDYRNVDRDIVWDVVKNSVPSLLEQLDPLVPAEPPEHGEGG